MSSAALTTVIVAPVSSARRSTMLLTGPSISTETTMRPCCRWNGKLIPQSRYRAAYAPCKDRESSALQPDGLSIHLVSILPVAAHSTAHHFERCISLWVFHQHPLG